MKKSKSQSSAESLGQRINELSSQPVPYELQVGGQVFQTFIHPMKQNDLDELQAEIRQAGKLTDEILKSAVARSFRDADGNLLWQSAEDVQVSAIVWARMRVPVLLHCFGIDPANL